VDTLITRSNAMSKDIKAIVISPEGSKDAEQRYPVVYLLHGHGGAYDHWLKEVPLLKEMVDQFQMIIVCPDGGIGSWYWDSPVDPAFRYETYIAQELVQQIDAHYPTIADRKGRAITGLSMGGHGALYLAFRHQEVFGAAGSMAGGVDIRPFPLQWDMAKRLGSQAEHPDRWEQHTVINMLHLLTPRSLALFIDCGTEDFFFKVNEQLHQKLSERNIPHTYLTRPGGHNWDYWRMGIPFQLQFYRQFFGAIIQK
jgi:S-formylglutathione hydrolase FrmB